MNQLQKATSFFEKPLPDTSNQKTLRQAGIDFLTHHFRYYTMNSWNRSTSYANNVKLYNLGLTSEELDKAFEILEAECNEDFDTSEYDLNQHLLFEDFYHKTGYKAGFNGRSNGYVVLYETRYDPEQQRTVVMPGHSMDDNEDFEEWETADILERVQTVTEFDKLCDNLRNLLLDYIHQGVTQTETVLVTKEVRTLTIPQKEFCKN